jgi:hypothetical protein
MDNGIGEGTGWFQGSGFRLFGLRVTGYGLRRMMHPFTLSLAPAVFSGNRKPETDSFPFALSPEP